MNEKLDVGGVLERVFDVYKSQFTLLIPAALLLFIPVAVVNGLLYNEGGALLSAIAGILSLVATYWYTAAVVEGARDMVDGRRDLSIGEMFRSAAPFILPVIVASVLAGIGIAIGFVLLIIPGLILLTIWSVIVPVIVIDKTGPLQAFGRSYHLVKGHGWSVFGVLVVIFLVMMIARLLIAGILGAITDSFAGFAVGDLIVSALLIPVWALVVSVLFFDLKALHHEPLPAGGTAGGLGGDRESGALPATPESGQPSGEPGGGHTPEPPSPGGGQPPGSPGGGTPPERPGGSEPRPGGGPSPLPNP